MNSSGLKRQQLHSSLVCTSDGICWPLSCFAHDLTWWARQLLHVGDDSVSLRSPKRLDTEKLEEGINALLRKLLGLPFQRASQP